MKRKFTGCVIVVVVGLALALILPTPGESQMCGDLDGSGGVSTGDLTCMIDHLYISNAPLSDPSVADMDGIAGVTGNDHMALIDVLFVSLEPPNCEIVPDTAFPVGTDTLAILIAPAQPGVTQWTAEMRLSTQTAYASIAVPFVWSASDPSVELDSIVIPTPTGSHYGKVDPVGHHGLFTCFSTTGDTYVPGNNLIATLHFSRQASGSPITVSIDTSGYPGTDHEVVISRLAATRPTGLKPVVVHAEGMGGCVATGDIDGSGGPPTAADVTAFVDFLCITHDVIDDVCVADITGDCIVDMLDVAALTCYVFGNCSEPPLLPKAVCCHPEVIFCGTSYEAAPLCGAEVEIDSSGGDTTYIVQVDTTGRQGVRYFPPGDGQTEGLRIKLTNADMSIEKAQLTFSFTGYVEDPLSKEEVLGPVGVCGVATPSGPNGRMQIVADFTPLGDNSITVHIYNHGSPVLRMTLYCEGLIAFAGDGISGHPHLESMELFAESPPAFRLVLDRQVPFEFCNSTVVYGDEIRLVALNATRTVSGVYSADVTGCYLGWFGAGYTSDVCCRGFAGNVDNDPTDIVSLGDLTALIDNLFISLNPVACMGEADLAMPRDGHTSLGDLTTLIDMLFITFQTPPPCP